MFNLDLDPASCLVLAVFDTIAPWMIIGANGFDRQVPIK
jgi:hypothetical protein